MTVPTTPRSLFDGYSVRVAEEEAFLVFRPARDNRFWSPPATSFLCLRTRRILHIGVVPLEHAGWVALHFDGDFEEGMFPDELDLAPVAAIDAKLLLPILAKRFHLPRRPKVVYPYDLIATKHNPIEWDTYLAVVGAEMPRGHFEGPDFEGVKLTGNPRLLEGRIPGKRYHVTGFYEPGWSGVGAPPVGYHGPSIRVRTLRPEPDGALRPDARRWSTPPSPSTRGPVTASLEPTANHGQEQLDFSTRPDPTTWIVAAIDGQGGQRTGDDAARLAQVTLATLLGEPDYGPCLGPPAEPPAHVLDDLAAWAAWLVDQTPLPVETSPLVTALAHRIGEVLEGANLRSCCLGASGILAVIRRGRATILRRGTGRAYLLRDGTLYPLILEHVLGRDAEATGQPDLVAQVKEHYWVPCSMFLPVDPEGTPPPLDFEVAPGDRLIFVVGTALLQALGDPAREALLTAATPDVTRGMPPTQAMIEEGWGVVTVDIGDATSG